MELIETSNGSQTFIFTKNGKFDSGHITCNQEDDDYFLNHSCIIEGRILQGKSKYFQKEILDNHKLQNVIDGRR